MEVLTRCVGVGQQLASMGFFVMKADCPCWHERIQPEGSIKTQTFWEEIDKRQSEKEVGRIGSV